MKADQFLVYAMPLLLRSVEKESHRELQQDQVRISADVGLLIQLVGHDMGMLGGMISALDDSVCTGDLVIRTARLQD